METSYVVESLPGTLLRLQLTEVNPALQVSYRYLVKTVETNQRG